jgi:hypothetical protein
MNPLIQLKKAAPVFLVGLVLACFALLPAVQAVMPAPDGGYVGWNTAEGQDALFSLVPGGGFNTAIGSHALYANTNGDGNTAVGAFTLAANSSGVQNVAIGQGALRNNTVGINNAATGFKALYFNTSGYQNTATGAYALYNNTTGYANTANGIVALNSNTTGIQNTAVGNEALYRNIAGDGNTANGVEALIDNTTGDNNTASGNAALRSNIDGSGNVASGYHALFNNIHGSDNIVLGDESGNDVIAASNVICIGANVAGASVSNTTWIGNVYGVTTLSGTTAPVIVSADGQLGTVASSERFKKDIATMENASEAILSLRPVTFHYKTDTTGTPQFGLIAEEVAKVNPALVLSDKEGKPYTVRYDAVNAMLLNEFLKEHSKIENLKNDFQATVAQQQKEIEALTATVKEQASQIQKVSAQLELSKSAPKTVLNNQ